MGNWDFLLQKKGDRQWGTAHKSTLKLKAGAYRLAAKGDVFADVAVTIAYDAERTETSPEIHKSQTRSKRTNSKGLMALLPFTQLKPGVWTITCHSLDIANPWEETLTINVFQAAPKPKAFRPLPLPPNPNLFSFEGSLSLVEETPSDDPEKDTEESVLDRSLAKLMAARNEAQKQESIREAVEATLQDLDMAEDEEDELGDWSTETAAGLLQGSLQELEDLLKEELEPIWQEMDQEAQATATPDPLHLQPPCLQLSLAQTTYVWSGDRPLTLAGEVAELAPMPAPYGDRRDALKLRFVLWNPKNSQKLITLEQDLPGVDFPQSFRQVIAIDENWDTLTVLGEVSLLAEGKPTLIFATQMVNLVADYQAIAARIQLPEIPPEDAALAAQNTPKDGLDLPNPDFIIAETVIEETAQGSILPPRLRKHASNAPHVPELPTFMQKPGEKRERDPVGEAVLEERATPETKTPALPGGEDPIDFGRRRESTPNPPLDPDDIPYPFVLEPEEENTPEPVADAPDGIESLPPGDPAKNLAEDSVEIAENSPGQIAPEELETPVVTVNNADLDWNSRFFQRLNSMAAEGQNPQWLQEPEPTPDLESDPGGDRPIPTEDEENPGGISNSEFVAEEDVPPLGSRRMEIVVDSLWDEEQAAQEEETDVAPVAYDASGLPYPQAVLPTEAAEISPDLGLSQPLPEPLLMLSKPEYQAEDMAVVRVKVPPYGDRLYVKLWLQDRQTRGLLSGPHQLTDFTPDAEGNLETLIQIPIPPGSIEVRFEAIAINPRLQQESRKVGVDRRVVPKNISEINWDDLEV